MAVDVGAVTQWDGKQIQSNSKQDGCCMVVCMDAVT
jgi:hypothetical protein